MSDNQISDTDELKNLVNKIVDDGKALLAYLEKNPGKLTALKKEIQNGFSLTVKMQLMKLFL